MPVTLSDLTTPISVDEAEEALLGVLATAGFPASAWQPFSVGRTLVRGVAHVWSDASELVASLAAAGFVPLASGAWLDALAEGLYDEERIAAAATVGTLTLTDAGGGPHVIAVGQLRALSDAGYYYVNTTGGTLTLGGTLGLTFTAEAPGAAYNAAGGTITQLATPLVGVSVAASSTWITSSGRDEETDAELRSRLIAKWGTLGTGSPALAYESWVRTGAPNVTRVTINDANPRGPGTIDIYAATNSGPATSGDVALAQAYVDARRPLGSDPLVIAPTAYPVTIAATVYVRAAYMTAAQVAIAAALSEYGAALDIGGVVYVSQIVETIMAVAGVRNCSVTSPAADLVIGSSSLAVLSLSLSYVAV